MRYKPIGLKVKVDFNIASPLNCQNALTTVDSGNVLNTLVENHQKSLMHNPHTVFDMDCITLETEKIPLADALFDVFTISGVTECIFPTEPQTENTMFIPFKKRELMYEVELFSIKAI